MPSSEWPPVVSRHPRVHCSVGDPRTRECVAAAVRAAQAQPVIVSGPFSRLELVRRVTAWVYDFVPADDRSVQAVRDAVRHSVRVLLYHDDTPSVHHSLVRVLPLAGVLARAQRREVSEEEALRPYVEALVLGASTLELRRRVKRLIGRRDESSQAMQRYVDGVLDALETGLMRTLSVEDIAGIAGVHLGYLQQRLRSLGLPRPKRLADWITILYVTWGAAERNDRVSTVARTIGLSARALYDMRQGLLPYHPGIGQLPPMRQFDHTYREFAARCGMRGTSSLAPTGEVLHDPTKFRERLEPVSV